LVADKAWKAYERWVAGLYGVGRIPVLGREGADIAVDEHRLWIDCKLRLEVPISWHEALIHAEALGYDSIRLVCTQDEAKSFYEFFRPRKLLSCTRTLIVQQRDVKLSLKPVEWLDHIAETAPEDWLPMVVMNKARRNYRESVALVEIARMNLWRASVPSAQEKAEV
jgi:hypothetical protein